MAEESYSFSTARARLEEIVAQVRKKDTSLEKSLDLLEEGVRLANACTELIDQQDWASAEATTAAHAKGEADAASSETVVIDAVADDAWADESEPVVADHAEDPSAEAE
jgi:exodeoxyribonuclease VII small subunit